MAGDRERRAPDGSQHVRAPLSGLDLCPHSRNCVAAVTIALCWEVAPTPQRGGRGEAVTGVL